jgi:membrane protease YdiL (CAAX protease family)
MGLMGNSGTPFDNEARAEATPPDGAEPATSAAPVLLAESGAPAATAPRPERYAHLPQDLRVPWSWLDLLLFFFFAIGCLFLTVQSFGFVAAIIAGVEGVRVTEVLLRPTLQLVVQVIWYSILLLYLCLMVRMRFRMPFWKTVGFRESRLGGLSRTASYLLLAGTGMMVSVVVGVLGGLLRPEGQIPMERLFQQRQSAIMILLAAVIVAPLVEEMLFRGWLYPVVARTFGVAAGVVLTGALFGMIHGPQLGWHWQLVGLLAGVGVLFTYVRARTGSVLPAYFLHLGYNGLQAIAFVIGTSGLRNLPTPGQ